MRANQPRLSYSAMQSFICPRKFYLGRIAGYESVDKPLPMRLGGMVSDILDELHSANLDLGKVNIKEKYTLTMYLEKWRWGFDEAGALPHQVEAVFSVLQGYVDLGYHAIKGKTQAKFSWKQEGYPQVDGYIDMLQYDDYIGWEFKYTQKDEAYTKFTLQDQLTTYFLAHPKVERFTVRTILNPSGTIKLGKNELIDVYRDRVYQDVLARPRHYFKDRSYWRNEFDYVAFKAKIRGIANDILSYLEIGKGDMNAFYQKNTPYTCYLQGEAGPPGPCEFLNICDSGVISETLYRRVEEKVYGPNEDTGQIIIK
jgi:hypothetical protein